MNNIDDIFKAILKINDLKNLDFKEIKEKFSHEGEMKFRKLRGKIMAIDSEFDKDMIQTLYDNYSDNESFDSATFLKDLEEFWAVQKQGQGQSPVRQSQTQAALVSQFKSDANDIFELNISGQISGAQIDDNNCQISYSFKTGSRFTQKFGQDKGCSQHASKIKRGSKMVWSMPFNVGQEGRSPIGWPKVQFEIIGKDWRQRDVIKGYGCINVPLSPGRHLRKARVFCPVSSQSISEFVGTIFSTKPEQINSEIMLTTGKGRDATRVVSKGEVSFEFQIMTNNLENLNQISY